MGLMSSLEKFGFGEGEELDITKEDEKKAEAPKKEQEPQEQPPQEGDYLYLRETNCPVCDTRFKSLMVRGRKVRKTEPDFDLRPRYENIDILKYDVLMCPQCGYAAMNRSFDHLSQVQIKRIKQKVTSRFTPVEEKISDTYTYSEAIDRYKMALVSAMAKNAKLSEKAYICLKIAWLRRDEAEEVPAEEVAELAELKESILKEYEGFYRQAYDGFLKSITTEMPPYCGMNTMTVDYILVNIAAHFKDKEVAKKYIDELIASPNATAKMKDRCRLLQRELGLE